MGPSTAPPIPPPPPAPPPPPRAASPSLKTAAPAPRPPTRFPDAPAPAPGATRRCDACGTLAPVGYVDFYQNIGLVVLRLHKRVRGNLCPRCASARFWELSLITLFAGWWGITSFFVTPIFLLMNLFSYATYRPVDASGRASRPGLIVAGGVMGAFGLMVLLFFGGALWLAHQHDVEYNRRDREYREQNRAPGEAAFSKASARITASDGATAYGNTPAAEELAARFTRIVEEKAKVAFQRAGGPSLDEGHFVAYCEWRQDRVCFLVRVPEPRMFYGEVYRTLLAIAWSAAQEVTSEARRDRDLSLGVGVRGTRRYEAIARGMGASPPKTSLDGVATTTTLYEFFRDADAPPRP